MNLKHVFPFVCGMAGSGCAAILCVATGTTANAIGVGGLPGILSIRPDSMGSFAACMVIAAAVPFVLTVMVGKKKPASADKTELKAFLTGKVITLKEVNDGVFSEGILGDGIAIIPEDDILYAPADGTVCALIQDSRYACGLSMDNGMELVLHIGIDTVDMKGDGFEYLVSEGQKVSAGTPLIRFDRAKIKAAGHPDTTMCIITQPGSGENIQFFTGMDAKAKVTVVAAFK